MASLELHAAEKTGGHGKEAGEDGRVTDGRVGRKTTMTTEESYGGYPRGAAEGISQGHPQRASPIVADHRQHKLAKGKADFSGGHQGRRFGSEGGGSGALMTEERGHFGGAEGRGQETEQGEGREDDTEVSLDLSDCSKEVRALAW